RGASEAMVARAPSCDVDAAPGLVRVGSFADWGSGRRRIGEVLLVCGGREVCPSGPGWIDRQTRHVPRAGPDAFHHRTRSRVFDPYELNTDSRGARTPQINCRPPHRACRGVVASYTGSAQAETPASSA